jgi:hypothetical protein
MAKRQYRVQDPAIIVSSIMSGHHSLALAHPGAMEDPGTCMGKLIWVSGFP